MDTGRSFYRDIAFYLGGTNNTATLNPSQDISVSMCPSRTFDELIKREASTSRWGGYICNPHVFAVPTNKDPYRFLANFTEPRKVIALLDGNGFYGCYPDKSHINSRVVFDHHEKANVIMLDGHSMSFTKEDILNNLSLWGPRSNY